MQVSLEIATIIFIRVVLVFSEKTRIGIALSKYQITNEAYITVPYAESLSNPLRSLKVFTNIACAAACTTSPETCTSYNLRKINGEENTTKVCELNGPYLGREHADNADFHIKPAACREFLVSGDMYHVDDSRITASGIWGPALGTNRSRLDTPDDGAWATNKLNTETWIQADLGEVMLITGVITQGRAGDNQWVKSYKFFYGKTEGNLEEYGLILPGNADGNSKVTNMLESPVLARFARINPQSWIGHISMRFDVIGC